MRQYRRDVSCQPNTRANIGICRKNTKQCLPRDLFRLADKTIVCIAPYEQQCRRQSASKRFLPDREDVGERAAPYCVDRIEVRIIYPLDDKRLERLSCL